MFNERHQIDKEKLKKWLDEKWEELSNKIIAICNEVENPTPTLLKRVETNEEKIKRYGKHINTMRDEIDELKEQIFSLTMQVERLQECEKMEQEEKQEKKYIVHRRSETGVELYIGHPFIQAVALEKPVYEITDDRYEAQEFTAEMAKKIRNEKNKHYEDCLMLWVISEVKQCE